jgi:hypothetical protein
MKPLVTPVPNLNGNSAESLMEQLTDVRRALDNAIHAFALASDCIHGRNFQTMSEGDSLQRKAQEAWYERTAALNAMAKEILDMQLAIMEQRR